MATVAVVVGGLGLTDRVLIVVVALRAGHQKQVFVGLGGAVADRLRHRVGLGPHDVRAQPPAIILQRKRYSPGNPDHVFGLESARPKPVAGGQCGALFGALRRSVDRTRARASATVESVVAVAQVQPQRAVRPEHATHLTEHRHHLLDVLGERAFKPQLPGNPVVAQPPIGRGGDHGLDRLRREPAEALGHVGDDDLDAHLRSSRVNLRARRSGPRTPVPLNSRLASRSL